MSRSLYRRWALVGLLLTSLVGCSHDRAGAGNPINASDDDSAGGDNPTGDPAGGEASAGDEVGGDGVGGDGVGGDAASPGDPSRPGGDRRPSDPRPAGDATACGAGQNGDTRCVGDLLQVCSGGLWSDVIDCTTTNQSCILRPEGFYGCG